MSDKVLVTGGGGFIGAWINRRLLRAGLVPRVFDTCDARTTARNILGPDAERLDWRVGDVADGDAVREAARDCALIVHLAALLTPACQVAPVRGAMVNLVGTLNVFEAARALGIERVLYMSSAGVFGPHDGATPLPTTLYGAYKLAGEGAARAYWADHGIASTGIRPLVVYGPGREGGLTAGPTLACRAAARGEAYTIPFSGESDFVYVDDVAAVFEAARLAGRPGAEVYNLTGEVASVEAVVGAIHVQVPQARIDVAGPALPVAARLAEGPVREVFATVGRTGLRAGIAATIAHYTEAAGR